tara:strand:- start:1227 stop:1610 length:384 start_codon:yes stop_codon:yes gene_type:complete
MSRLTDSLHYLPPNQTYISMRELPAVFQRITSGESKLSQYTFRRWMRDGVRGNYLRRVKLHGTCTRLDWLFEFIAQCEQSERACSRKRLREHREEHHNAEPMVLAMDKAGVRHAEQADRECLEEGIA